LPPAATSAPRAGQPAQFSVNGVTVNGIFVR
jgi:hypothetical protein